MFIGKENLTKLHCTGCVVVTVAMYRLQSVLLTMKPMLIFGKQYNNYESDMMNIKSLPVLNLVRFIQALLHAPALSTLSFDYIIIIIVRRYKGTAL